MGSIGLALRPGRCRQALRFSLAGWRFVCRFLDLNKSPLALARIGIGIHFEIEIQIEIRRE
jgi:hypothetical protein